MRPVPVTFLRFAFSDQLSVMHPCQRLTLGKALGRKPKRASCWKRTLADLSGRVAARSAGLLLVVERTATGENNLLSIPAVHTSYRPLVLLAKRSSRLVLGPGVRVDLPATSAETVGLGVAGNKSQDPWSTSDALAGNQEHTACRSWRYPWL